MSTTRGIQAGISHNFTVSKYITKFSKFWLHIKFSWATPRPQFNVSHTLPVVMICLKWISILLSVYYHCKKSSVSWRVNRVNLPNISNFPNFRATGWYSIDPNFLLCQPNFLRNQEIWIYTIRSLLFQGAYNRGTAENKWAAIAHENYTALVQRTSTRGRTARTKTAIYGSFLNAPSGPDILCCYHYDIRSCTLLGIISSW